MSTSENLQIDLIDQLPSELLVEIIQWLESLDWMLAARQVSKAWLQAVSRVKLVPRTHFYFHAEDYAIFKRLLAIFPQMKTGFMSIEPIFEPLDIDMTSFLTHCSGVVIIDPDVQASADCLASCVRQRTTLRNLSALEFDAPFHFPLFNALVADLDPPPNLKYVRSFAATFSNDETMLRLPPTWMNQLETLSVFSENTDPAGGAFELDFRSATRLRCISIGFDALLEPKIYLDSTRLHRIDLWAGSTPATEEFWMRTFGEQPSGSQTFDTTMLRTLRSICIYNYDRGCDLAAISWMTQLTKLQLWPLSQLIHATELGRLKNLRKLALGHQEGGAYDGDDLFDCIHDLPNLTHLHLHNTYMTKLDGSRFKSAPRLRALDVTAKLEGLLDALQNHFPSLKTLKIAWDQYTFNGSRVFPNHIQVLHLYGSGNNTDLLPNGFEPRQVAAMFPGVKKLVFNAIYLNQAAPAIVGEFAKIRAEPGEFGVEEIRFGDAIYIIEGRVLAKPTKIPYTKLASFV